MSFSSRCWCQLLGSSSGPIHALQINQRDMVEHICSFRRAYQQVKHDLDGGGGFGCVLSFTEAGETKKKLRDLA